MISKHLDQIEGPFQVVPALLKSGLNCQELLDENLIVSLSMGELSRVVGDGVQYLLESMLLGRRLPQSPY